MSNESKTKVTKCTTNSSYNLYADNDGVCHFFITGRCIHQQVVFGVQQTRSQEQHCVTESVSFFWTCNFHINLIIYCAILLNPDDHCLLMLVTRYSITSLSFSPFPFTHVNFISFFFLSQYGGYFSCDFAAQRALCAGTPIGFGKYCYIVVMKPYKFWYVF